MWKSDASKKNASNKNKRDLYLLKPMLFRSESYREWDKKSEKLFDKFPF